MRESRNQKRLNKFFLVLSLCFSFATADFSFAKFEPCADALQVTQAVNSYFKDRKLPFPAPGLRPYDSSGQLKLFVDDLDFRRFDITPNKRWHELAIGDLNKKLITETDFSVVGVDHPYGIYGIYFHTPLQELEDDQFLIAMDILRNGGLAKLGPSQVGIGIHMKNKGNLHPSVFWVFDLGRFYNSETSFQTLTAYKNIGETFREDLIFPEYRKRLGMGEDDIQQLRKVSIEVEERTLIFVSSEESFIHPLPDKLIFFSDTYPMPHDRVSEIADTPHELTPMPPELTLKGGLAAVWANQPAPPVDDPDGEGQNLPLEATRWILPDGTRGKAFRVERKPGDLVVEIGRFAVRKDGSEKGLIRVTPRIVQQMAATIAGMGKISKIVLIADEVHSRLFKRDGFVVTDSRLNYRGDTEFLMEFASPSPDVSADALLLHALRRDFPEKSNERFKDSLQILGQE